MKKFAIILLGMSLLQTHAYAQEKPMRIGVKIGVPNVIGLNLEYVTPWLNGRLAPTVDITYFPVNIIDPSYASTSYQAHYAFSYFELGANYYFFDEGKWMYANVSFGRFGLNYSFTDYYSENDPALSGGFADSDFKANLLNFKIGAKLGHGFYFRPEIGVAVVGLPNYFTYTVIYPDGSTETEVEDLSDFIGITPVLNLGFGVAF